MTDAMASKRVKRKTLVAVMCTLSDRGPAHERLSLKVHMKRIFFAFFFCSLVCAYYEMAKEICCKQTKIPFFGVQRGLGSISAAFGGLSMGSFPPGTAGNRA